MIAITNYRADGTGGLTYGAGRAAAQPLLSVDIHYIKYAPSVF